MGDRASAIQLYNQAVTVVNDKTNPQHLQMAYKLFTSACHVDPTWSECWFQAGNNNSDLNLLPASVACYRRALECQPQDDDKKASILCNLGWRLHCLGQTTEALAATHEAVRLCPHMPYAWVNLSLMHGILDDDKTSIECAEQAYKIMPLDPIVEISLAFALLFGRQFQQGLKHFESRFPYKLKEYLQYPYPKWTGEPNKTVFLCADQGLGDTLCYARFVEMACKRAKYVHARIQPELMRVFANALGHIPNLNLVPQPCPFPAADAWTTFVSLPFALGLSDDEFRNQKQIEPYPYMMPVKWRIPDRKLHVGIAWGGSPLNEIDRHRNLPLDQFMELQRVPGVQLYSLQVGQRAGEMHEQGFAALMGDLSGYVRDVADTLAILRDLDLVITCESALGHICALAGKECWIPYSYLGRDYRIGHTGQDRIWAPQHRIFRQGADQDWRPVFRTITEALRERIDVNAAGAIAESPRAPRLARA